jgi:AcrR family transcriptional regulator
VSTAAQLDVGLAVPLLPPTPKFSPARRRVFEAAIVLFGERGYHAVSVKDIAGALSLTPMALYTHAASKQDLLFEIVKIGFETHRAEVGAALLEAGADPVDQIRALVAAHVRVHLQYAPLARVTIREVDQLDERFGDQLDLLRTESVRTFFDVVERGQRLGVFTDADPELLIHAVAGLGTRAPDWWTPTSRFSADEVVETFTRFAVSILTAELPR